VADLAPPEDTLYRELKRTIDEAVRSLPDRRRQVYLLSRHEGLRQQEIAERLGISLQTVKNTLGDATEDIRVFLVAKGLLALAVIFTRWL